MKRIVAYLLALSMFFSLILVTPVLADGSDYNNKNVEYAADVLSGLDIYRKSSSATNRITRMEFLTALCEIIDKGDIIPFEENNVKHITDVSGADLKYVDLALKKGIIKNPSDGKFNPNGNVDMDFASYALVAMIGYFQDVQNDTHIKRAQAMGLTKDVRNSDALTYADVVLMLYNMLDSQFLEQVVYGNTSQFVESEITVLEHFFGLKKFDARLIANSCTDLSGAIELADGYIALQRTKDGIIETYKCNYNRQKLYRIL